MTIQITKPEVEALINQRLQTGGFKDATSHGMIAATAIEHDPMLSRAT